MSDEARRLVSRDGHSQVKVDHVEGLVQLFLHDLWTTVVDMKWRYKITLFASTFVSTWFLFGVIFYLIGLRNGDFTTDQYSNHTPCVMNVASLTGAYLFSLESQTTIGYGFRHVSEECPLAIVALVLQLVLTGLAEIFVTGAFLAKLARPKKRAGTVRFSRQVVVCWRNGRWCLMVRVANMRSSLLIQCQLSAKLITPYVTLEVCAGGLDGECAFLQLPMTFIHELDERSPLADLTATNLASRELELLLTLTGSVEATAATCRSRCSYLPREILWGQEFCPMLTRSHSGRLEVDLSRLDKVQPCRETPETISAGEKTQLEKDYRRE
ncbi:hypothetical protein DNTS_016002 [Danionella cerebrum]|uniref:Uncharacterized protein n=1 Tax=Danionella cerebrum TaxID=2873325 RepID=A0A553RHQ9_9TELE|nr:hypothetical protein DNTS_016002 [Danionella translucida]TRZ01719.1 hypothetical protein DNTS_016002 [Danionella translucida]